MKIQELKPRPRVENEDGIFGMEDGDYRKAQGLSQSMLKVLMPPGSCEVARSPAHFHAALSLPPKPPTPAQVLGTITDHALLEPELYEGSFHVRPEGMNFTSREGKLWRDGHGDKPIIYAEDLQMIQGMIVSVKEHPIASVMLEQSYKQASIFCGHAPTGIVRKGRMDMLLLSARGRPVIADLKTCENGSPHQFSRDAAHHGYHIQAAYYSDIMEDIVGERPAFVFVTVEKCPPYPCTVYQFDEESMDTGLRLCNDALHLYMDCAKSKSWPAYSQQIETLRLPAWVNNPRPAIVPDWELIG